MKKIFVNNLTVGESIVAEFMIRKCELKDTSAGKFYLSFELVDKEGRCNGVYWGDDSQMRYKDLPDGAVIRIINGLVQSYKGQIQIRINDIKRLIDGEYDPYDFIPSSKYPTDEMWSKFMQAVDLIKDNDIRKLIDTILDDKEMVELFKKAPGGKRWHHSYLGGLLEHSISVCRNAITGATNYSNVNKDILIAGALLHDIGKTREFVYDMQIDYSEEGRLIGHIVLGTIIVNDYISKIPDFPEIIKNKLLHIIISHHGELEYGAPIKPMTVEAEIIYHADHMDAEANAFSHIIEKDKNSDRLFSDYVNLRDRYLYLR